jgi:lipopolysaccharide transport system permease protein
MSNQIELAATKDSGRGDRSAARLRDAAAWDSPHVTALPPETVIAAGRSGKGYLRDLWRYRELFLFLAWRDLLVRYKQTFVGVAWSLIRPILTMLVLTVVFGKLGNMPSGGAPYPLLVFCGILPWQFFATALSESGNSLVANTGLISKVYFPRLLIPAGTLVTATVDLLISLAFLAVLMTWYGWMPPAQAVWLPLFLLVASIASFGVGVWIAALMVQYRDFRFIVPFLIQFGLYISPVGFLSSVVPERYRLLYDLNPMVGVIDGFRWCILGGQHGLHWGTAAWSAAASTLLVVTGIHHFRRTERTFADVI